MYRVAKSDSGRVLDVHYDCTCSISLSGDVMSIVRMSRILLHLKL